MRRVEVVKGQRFGRLRYMEEVSEVNGRRRARFICDCGNITEAQVHGVRYGKTKSCGCLLVDALRSFSFQHGGTVNKKSTPEYMTWLAMRERCLSPKNNMYPRYGGRGITVCDEWKHSFSSFLSAVGCKPSPAHSLDRYPNNNGNYEPGNVRWATRTEQARNKECLPQVSARGEIHLICEWAEISGIPARLISARMKKGWTAERAIFEAINIEKRNHQTSVIGEKHHEGYTNIS